MIRALKRARSCYQPPKSEPEDIPHDARRDVVYDRLVSRDKYKHKQVRRTKSLEIDEEENSVGVIGVRSSTQQHRSR
jgi:hypothetical protein